MYIEKLTIKNFRGIEEASINFNKTINILIGSNNIGKSAIIDSLRLIFSYGSSQKRDIYIGESDFHISTSTGQSNTIEFHLRLKIEDPSEAGMFYDLLTIDPATSEQSLNLHFRYTLESHTSHNKIKLSVWGGENEGQPVSTEIFDNLYFVNLGALRDVEKHLRPIRGNKLGGLYKQLVTSGEDEKLVEELKKGIETPEWKEFIEKGESKINEHLKHTTFINDPKQEVSIAPIPFDFEKIADSMTARIPFGGSDYLELYQNGLGYNNLIYTATVLGDLDSRSEHYKSLLIEEPEAHLHPQLQNVLFGYLESYASDFQTFLTSHSPTITAKTDLDSIIVMNNIDASMKSLALKKSALDSKNKKYLSKFLDVTKSQLFFAKGVIFVEGISEALLLPIFAKVMGDEYDLEKNGIEVVNINGVAFSHFANLFNNDDSEKNIGIRAAILTDSDSDKKGGDTARADRAKALKNADLVVKVSDITFENELYKPSNNAAILKAAAKELHPRSYKSKYEDTRKTFSDSVEFKNFVADGKSEFAHILSVKLYDNLDAGTCTFEVPDYIQEAIEWVLHK